MGSDSKISIGKKVTNDYITDPKGHTFMKDIENETPNIGHVLLYWRTVFHPVAFIVMTWYIGNWSISLGIHYFMNWLYTSFILQIKKNVSFKASRAFESDWRFDIAAILTACSHLWLYYYAVNIWTGNT
jgi:hypothetical protein